MARIPVRSGGSPAWLAHNQVVNRLPAPLALLHTLEAGGRGPEDK